jgi:hypothetical protein
VTGVGVTVMAGAAGVADSIMTGISVTCGAQAVRVKMKIRTTMKDLFLINRRSQTKIGFR